jgi:transcriptional regulator GlxA family with amidase domain
MKVEAVARSVGYAEVSSFSKAFARWSGGSPTTYRSSVAERPTARGGGARKRR